MMRVRASKVLVCAIKFCSPINQRFRSANQNFGCLNPQHFLVSLIKNEGQPNQDFTLNQPNRYLVVPKLTKGWKRLQHFYECVTFVRIDDDIISVWSNIYLAI